MNRQHSIIYFVSLALYHMSSIYLVKVHSVWELLRSTFLDLEFPYQSFHNHCNLKLHLKFKLSFILELLVSHLHSTFHQIITYADFLIILTSKSFTKIA